MEELDDLRTVGERVIKPAVIAIPPSALAEIGKVKPALAVEDQVVRRRQLVAAALAVENARLAAARIDALDGAALVILGRPGREKPALRILVAAIVADIESAVRASRDPVRPAAGRRDRALGKPQPRRHYAQIRHHALLRLL